MSHRRVASALVTMALLLASTSALALESDEYAVQEKKSGFPLSGSALLENSVGMGSFVENPDTGEMQMPYYSLILTLRGAWRLSEKLSLRGRFDVEKEITSSYATSTTERHQISPADMHFSLVHSELFADKEFTGIKLGGDLRLYFPTSRESRYASRIGGVSSRLQLSRGLGGFTFVVGSRYVRYLARYSHGVVPPYEEHPGQAPCGGVSVDSGTICGGSARVHTTWIHDFTVGYDITNSLSVAAYLFIINRFSYAPTEPDELSSEYATGENQRDATWGVVDVSYKLNDWLAYSVGVSSYQPAKKADGQSLRFPFWDSESPANNFTTFYMDIEGSF